MCWADNWCGVWEEWGEVKTVKKLVIATKNKGKLREMRDAFAGLPFEVLSLAQFGDMPEPVEDGETFRENARIKARFYGARTGCACIADDSGLEVEALGCSGVSIFIFFFSAAVAFIATFATF